MTGGSCSFECLSKRFLNELTEFAETTDSGSEFHFGFSIAKKLNAPHCF